MPSIFPADPEINDIYVKSASVSYLYNGTAWVRGNLDSDIFEYVDSKLVAIDGGTV
jgi:hypothetical protein